jgi:Domain of unknown function (DUF4942)
MSTDDFDGVRTKEALSIHATATELARTFAEVEREVRVAFASIVVAEQRVNAVFTLEGDRPIRVSSSGHWGDKFNEPDRCIIRMRRAAWQTICERLELRRIMSIERWEKLQNQLRDDKDAPLPPELTEEMILAFVRQNAIGLPEMMAEAVREVYEWLRPRSRSKHGRGKYKTNSLLEVGPKVVLGILDHGPYTIYYRVRFGHEQNLACMERVFQMLDGQGMASKVHTSEIQNAIQSEDCTRTGTFETAYFQGHCYRNGNAHVTFKRRDLLERFNQIAGGARLRPGSAAA